MGMSVMRAGIGKAALTPPLGTELAGYGYYLKRRAARIRDDLYARAIALERGQACCCLVACDVLGLSGEITDAVRAVLWERHKCPPENVILVSTHTHTGPAIKHHEGTGEVDPGYVGTVAPTIVKACDAAFSDMANVTGMSMAMAETKPPLCWYRTGGGALPDHHVRAVRLARAGKDPLALVSYACHAVARGRSDEISADYPGKVCERLAANGIQAVFVNGVCGDIDPLPPHGGDLAERMADAIARAALKPGKRLPARMEAGMIRETLRLMPATRESIQKAAGYAARNETIPGGARVARKWEDSMLRRLDTLPRQETFPVRWLRLGGVPIVALPFEAFAETGALIREAMEEPRAMALGCADELMGYLPTSEEYEKGAYAALESTFLYKRLPPLAQEARRLGLAIGSALKALAPA